MPNNIMGNIGKMLLIIPAMARATLDGTNHTFFGTPNAGSAEGPVPLHGGDASAENTIDSLPYPNGTYLTFSNSSAHYRSEEYRDGALFAPRVWANVEELPCNMTLISAPPDPVIAGTVIEIKKSSDGRGAAPPRACKEVNYGKLLAVMGTPLYPTEEVRCFEQWIVDQLNRICREDRDKRYKNADFAILLLPILLGSLVTGRMLLDCQESRTIRSSRSRSAIGLFDSPQSLQPLLSVRVDEQKTIEEEEPAGPELGTTPYNKT